MERYSKVKQIGEGSFGKALLVRHKENGKQFVVKEINMSRMAKKERDEARKEVAVLAQLNHANIVTYRESFEEIGNLYIVMDFCDGGDLYGRINTQRGLLFTEDQILDWFVQTCLAIKHIHDRKILHRDIKSQNIFLTRHGIVKLGDFGIAKVLNSTVELARTCIGTPYYLSPEICENKPYNNKSDIWSLGCVLYELTTLKHAFEAGNMKNLVLKIIRGNFPPPPPRYSYELRNLINQLFKRSPRDRPSINTLLKKPLLQARIRKYLSESEVAEEFSHTVMHGVKMKKILPPGAGRPLPPKPVSAKKPPSAPTPKYNPASVYGVPVSRKSREAAVVKKSSDARRSGGGAKKPSNSSGGGNAYHSDLARKKQELIDKEKKRREEIKKKEDNYAKQHQALIEKQKIARMNKAREAGWKSLIDSLSSEDSNKKVVTPRNKYGAKAQFINCKRFKKAPYVPLHKSSPRSDEVKKVTPPAPKPTPVRQPLQNRPNYNHYHEYLDKLQQERKADNGPAPVVSHRPMPVSKDVSGGDGDDQARGVAAKYDPAFNAMRGQAAGAHGHAAAEKARLVEEYMQRRAQAAHNRARAHGDLYGGAKGAINPTPAPKPSVGAPRPSAAGGVQRPQSARDNAPQAPVPSIIGRPLSAREQQEQEYLSRLKQIRLQNFNERRGVKADKIIKANDQFKPPKQTDVSIDVEMRRKKIEALRAQADERAQRLKKELERKRQMAYDQERRNLQNMAGAAKPQKAVKPSPAVPITQVMKAIGAGPKQENPQDKPAAGLPITQALNAIGVAPKQPEKSKEPTIGMTAAMGAIGASVREEESRASIQKTKEHILKRLNAKSIDQAPLAAENKQDRPKWGQAVKPALPDRPKWGGEGDLENLENIPLEQTASVMEATAAGDVLKYDDEEKQSKCTDRKGWGGKPSSTVLNLLKAAALSESYASNATAKSDSSESSTSTPSVPQGIGKSTITIDKSPDGKAPVITSTITISRDSAKGTVVIKKVEQSNEQNDEIDNIKNPKQQNNSSSNVKELVIDEEKEEDEAESQQNESKVEENIAENNKTSLSVTSAKSRSPSPKSKSQTSPRLSPKTSPKSSPKNYLPEVDDIKDLADDKSPLFNKVDLEDEDKDCSKEEDGMKLEDLDDDDNCINTDICVKALTDEDPIQPKSKSALLFSLKTGNFDIGNVGMLRTCSEPNLAKLFNTNLMENPFYTEEEVAKSVQLASALLENPSDDEEDEDVDAELVRASLQKVMDQEESGSLDEDEENLGYSMKDIADMMDEEEEDQVDDETAGVDEQDVDDDASDDSDEENDMETLRQSMMDILDDEGTISDEGKTKKSSKRVSKKIKKARKKRRDKIEAAESAATEAGKKSLYARQWSASSVEDFKSMRETMKSLLQPDSGTSSKLSPVKENATCGDQTSEVAVAKKSEEETLISLNPNTEAWQSDDDCVEPDDEYWEEEDMFSRLEENRMKLEEELGCETFMQAYKTVQAIHEDEDENIEEGLKLVTKILGAEKSHLYPSILQLVMADGVWTEDND